MTEEPLTVSSKYSNILRATQDALTYTEIPVYVEKELKKICRPRRILTTKDCASCPTTFAYHMLGITPYKPQYMLFEYVKKGEKRIACIQHRQGGKTLGLGLIGLWAANYNTMASGLHKNTKVVIISKSENQAKKIIYEIKRLIDLGDKTFAIRTRRKCMDVLSRALAEGQPQTATQITFSNGSSIKSLSPTDSARGYTADLLIVDEFAYIPEDLFYDVFEPMTSAVNGMIMMASTPSGAQGLGYRIFDPYNERVDVNPYKRLWIPWWYCENPIQKALIEQKKEQWIAEGKLRNFQQEYEAKFTVSETNFFDADKVDAAVDESMTHVMEWKSEPCSLGIDYGWKSSKTVISIVSKGNDNIIRERFMHAYDTDGSDVRLLEDMEALMKRFNILHIVPDDCSAGYKTNMEMTNKGWPVKEFNFRTDQNIGERNRGYYMLRAGLYQGKIKLVKNHALLKELKQLLEIKKQVNVSIKAPPGEFDDRCFVAGTKVLTDKGKVLIEKIRVGDMVMTRNGYEEVLATNCHYTDKSDIITRIGLTGTKDHPVITKEGIVKLININVSDTLYIWNEKQSSIMELSITDILNQKVDIPESIIGVIQNGIKLQNHSIGRFGKIIMGRYLKEIISTIKTGIHRIMPWKTLNVSHPKIIAKNITLKKENSNQENALNTQGKRLKSGINQKKEELGTENITKTPSRIENSTNITVSYVGGNSKVTGLKKQSSVLLNAVRKSGSVVVGALKRLRSIRRRRKVYNLTIENHNEFFANNILVHNSDGFLMACYPFMAEDEDSGDMIAIVGQREISDEEKKITNPRYDKQWARIKGEI